MEIHVLQPNPSKHIRVVLAIGVLWPAAALAEPTVERPAPHITIFRDGDHIVTLVGRTNPRRRPPLDDVINEKEFGDAKLRNRIPQPSIDRQLPNARDKEYYVRVRVLEGRLVCEKFAARPENKPAEERAAELFKESCI